MLRQRPLSSPLPRPTIAVDPEKQARFRSCLLAGAAGDALGAPVEFMGIGDIRNRFGTAGIRDYALCAGKTGAITDVTQMTLFTAEGLLRAANRARRDIELVIPEELANAYRRWLLTLGEGMNDGGLRSGWLIRHRDVFARRAPGNTCLTALRAKRPGDTAALNDSKGCGGAMRAAPLGLFVDAWCKPPAEEARLAFDLGCQAAALTHGHPAGQHPAGVLALLVLGLVQGATLAAVLEEARAMLLRAPDYGETLAAVDLAVRLAG